MERSPTLAAVIVSTEVPFPGQESLLAGCPERTRASRSLFVLGGTVETTLRGRYPVYVELDRQFCGKWRSRLHRLPAHVTVVEATSVILLAECRVRQGAD